MIRKHIGIVSRMMCVLALSVSILGITASNVVGYCCNCEGSVCTDDWNCCCCDVTGNECKYCTPGQQYCSTNGCCDGGGYTQAVCSNS
jgi:hypothetical protein